MAVYDDEDNKLVPGDGEKPDSSINGGSTEKDDLERDYGDIPESEGGFYSPSSSESKTKKSKKDEGDEEESDLESGGFYTASNGRGSSRSGRSSGSSFGGFSNRTLFSLFAGAALFIIVPLLLLLFMLSSGFQIEHINRTLTAYRFGTFHRQVSKRVTHIAAAASADPLLTEGSPRLDRLSNTSLFNRYVRGFNPQDAFRQLGARDIQITTERRGITRRPVITQIVNANTGQTIALDGSAASFNQLEGLISEVFPNDEGFRRGHRRAVFNLVTERAGIRLTKWSTFIDLRRAGQRLTRSEARITHVQEGIEVARGGGDGLRLRSGLGDVNEASDQLVETILETGEKPDRRAQLRNSATLRRIGNASQAAFIATMSCIARDLAGTTQTLIQERIYQPQRFAASFSTRADQIRTGDTSTEAVRTLEESYDGFEQSGAYNMALGRPLERANPEFIAGPELFPTTVFGIPIEDIDDFAGIVESLLNPAALVNDLIPGFDIPLIEDITDGVIDDICNLLLNPTAQFGIAIIETGATILTLGTARGIAQSARVAIETAVQIGIGIAASEWVFGRLVPQYIEAVGGVEYVDFPGFGGENANKLDVGQLLLSQHMATQSGAPSISAEVLTAQTREYMNDYKKSERSKGFFYAWFSPNNPFSFTSSVAVSMPSSVAGFRSLTTSIGSSFNPFSAFTSRASAQATYPSYLEYYGMQENLRGFTDQIANGEGDFNFVDNTIYVEQNLDRYRTQYGDCLLIDQVDIALDEVPDNCDDLDAVRYSVYYLDCDLVDTVSNIDNGGSFYSQECNYVLPDGEGVRDTPTDVSPDVEDAEFSS